MERTILPPMDLIVDEITTLARTAQAAGDMGAANAFNRAAEQLAAGVRPLLSGGDLLVPSRETAGTVYRVAALGCSCKAGVNGRQCWHAAIWEGIANAWDSLDAMDTPAERETDPEPPRPAPALRLVRPDLGDDAEYVAWLARAA